jgi:hypothetical protein
MLRFYTGLAWKVPKLIKDSTTAVQYVTVGLVTLLTSAGPGLVRYGQGDLAAYAGKVPAWWPAVPVSPLVILGLLKAKYALHQEVEDERDMLAKRLRDRQRRHADAEELGKLRQRMRKRYLEWLKDESFSSSLPPWAKDKAQELQEHIASILDERYGFDLRDRFITADNADSTNPQRRLPETEEYAARIKRLRGIIIDIRRGRVRRRVS